MILFKNRLIVGVVWKIIKMFFTVVYSVLSFFSLHYTLLLALIGVVLHFTGTLEANRAVLVVYALLLVLSIVYAVVASIKKLLGLDKHIKKKKGVHIVENPTVENAQPPNFSPQCSQQGYEQSPVNTVSETPKYYRVRQNPNFIMAEYSNRYELFVIENGTLKKIRTDYK